MERTYAAFELVPPGSIRDSLNDAVLRGTKTATSRLAVMDEMWRTPLEPVGTRMLLLDSQGTVATLIEITETRVVPFGAITADVSRREGEWLSSLEDWYAAHTRYWKRILPEIRTYLSDDKWDFTEETPVHVRFFTCIKEDQ